MTDIKQIVETIRITKADIDKRQPKTYADPRHQQYRSQYDRMTENLKSLRSHVDIDTLAKLAQSVDTIDTAFRHYTQDGQSHAQAQRKMRRLANVHGYLADVIGHGVEYGRHIKNATLSPEELNHANSIGRENAVKLAMHAFARELLPLVGAIRPIDNHHLNMDGMPPGNHNFILHNLDKALAPPVTEDHRPAGHLLGDAALFLKRHQQNVRTAINTKLQQFADNADTVSKLRLNYDNSGAPFMSRLMDTLTDLHAVATGETYRIANNPDHRIKYQAKGRIDFGSDAGEPLNPMAHHKYFDELDFHPYTSEYARNLRAFHIASAQGDQEAIHSAAAALRDADQVPPAYKEGRTRRKLSLAPTTGWSVDYVHKNAPPPKEPDWDFGPDVPKDIQTQDYPKASNRKAWVRAPAIKSTLDHVPYGQAHELPLSTFNEPDRHDTGTFGGFASTLSARPSTALVPAGKPTDHIPLEKHEIIEPPPKKWDDLDALNGEPGADYYPRGLHGLKDLSPPELDRLRKSSLKHPPVTSTASVLKSRIKAAVDAKMKNFRYQPSGETPSFEVPNPLDFKHKPYQPKPAEPKVAPLSFHTLFGYGNGIMPLHDVLTSAAKFSTDGGSSPKDAAIMVEILGPTDEAHSKVGFNNPIEHSARVWKNVHETIRANPDLHNDPRAHAALHFARLAHNSYAERPTYPKDNEQYHTAESATYMHDMANVLAPQGYDNHPALQSTADSLRAEAKKIYNSDTPRIPELDRAKRNLQANLMKRGRRIARSEGAAKVRSIINTITSHPAYKHIEQRLGDAWNDLREEQQLEWCALLIEDQAPPWSTDLFGEFPKDFDHFDHAVYQSPEHRDGLRIPQHPKPRKVNEIIAEDPHLDDDKVTAYLAALGTDMPSSRNHNVRKASLAIRSAMEDRSRYIAQHNAVLNDVKTDPSAFHRIKDIAPPAIQSVGDVARLADAIKTHLTTDPHDKTIITNPTLHSHVEYWQDRFTNPYLSIGRGALNLAKKVAPIAKATGKTAVDAVADLAYDAVIGPAKFAAGARPGERRQFFLPRSSLGRLVTRAGIAFPYAVDDVIGTLTGGFEPVNKIAQKNQRYKNDLENAGLMMDPIDKKIVQGQEKKATRLRGVKTTVKEVARKKKTQG